MEQNNETTLSLTEQEAVRREKLKWLEERGVKPFGERYDRTYKSGELKGKYENCTKEELEELDLKVKIAGRIMTRRNQGKVGFMHIQDIDGQIQIYVRKDAIGEEAFEIFKKGFQMPLHR